MFKPGDKVRIRLGVGHQWDLKYLKARDDRTVFTILSRDVYHYTWTLDGIDAEWMDHELEHALEVNHKSIKSWSMR